jgi:hypothetical protein
MSESPSEETEPETPLTYPRRRQSSRDVTPTYSSPPASASLSFHSLDVSPFSPLRQQVSTGDANSSDAPEDVTTADDYPHVTEDTKAVLIQRLNDLTAKLSDRDEIHGGDVDKMHAKMDELEQVLSHGLKNRPLQHIRNRSSLSMSGDSGDLSSEDPQSSWLGLRLSETVTTKRKPDVSGQADVPEPPAYHQQRLGVKDSAYANHILTQAQQLKHTLEVVVNNLQARQEEQEVSTMQVEMIMWPC